MILPSSSVVRVFRYSFAWLVIWTVAFTPRPDGSVTFIPPSGEVVCTDAYTAVAQRGRSIHTALLHAMLVWAQQAGYVRAYTYIALGNTRSSKAHNLLQWQISRWPRYIVLSSPLLVSHLAAAQEMAALAGFTSRQARQLIEPIARATLDNFFLRGTARSFSGPIARGDAQSIRLHLQALEPHPILAGVYRSLALYALEALPANGRKELRASLLAK